MTQDTNNSVEKEPTLKEKVNWLINGYLTVEGEDKEYIADHDMQDFRNDMVRLIETEVYDSIKWERDQDKLIEQAKEQGRQAGIKEACEKLRMEKKKFVNNTDIASLGKGLVVDGYNQAVDELNNRIKLL